MPTKPDNSRQKELSVRQVNAIDLLLTGNTDSEVAKTVGVTRQTVNGWRNHNAVFVAELNSRRTALWEASQDQIRSLIPAAIGALSRAIEEEGALSAAAHVLRAAGVYGQAMEPTGSVEPQVVGRPAAGSGSLRLETGSLVDYMQQRLPGDKTFDVSLHQLHLPSR